ncbi:FlgO family outer membrane protein [Paraglaciecola sp. L3A3]|uniref:FlgO family outer membrane protein n=1 Tax=Paraglaciecola sp. L3A3 TaxID=2686358 RepID=UPI001E3C8AA5|nr:FlgO family outer membrane protein [Paraglaciecola sp. L3A3]
MILKTLPLLISLTLSGCAIFGSEEMTDENSNFDNLSQRHNISSSEQNADPLQSSLMFQKQFNNNVRTEHKQSMQTEQQAETQANQHNKKLPQQVQYADTHNINYYVRGLMQDLMANLEYVNETTPVAVTSFVMLNSDYNQANILGIQIAESLIHEVHKFGIPVIDFKTTGYIRVTEKGDFAFSKDYEELSEEMPARYIVGGTMLKINDGYLINARIVGIKSQAVVASAQSLIPNHISEPILIQAASRPLITLNETVDIDKVALTNGKMVKNTSLNQVRLIPE